VRNHHAVYEYSDGEYGRQGSIAKYQLSFTFMNSISFIIRNLPLALRPALISGHTAACSVIVHAAKYFCCQ
jgi:hypothetical protein